jgi:hypothetical protein
VIPWWSFLRSLFIRNEFWHQPDLFLLAVILRRFETARFLYENPPPNVSAVDIRALKRQYKEWQDRASSLSLIQPDGTPIPLRTVPGPTTIIQQEQRRLSSYALVPYGCRDFSFDITYDREYEDALKPAIKALARMRSYYNAGRMTEGPNGFVGPPPLVSLQYKRIYRSSVKFYDFASWSGSKSPKSDQEIYAHICDVAYAATEWRGTIPDPRATLDIGPDSLSAILDLPRLCNAILDEEPYESTDFDPTDEVLDIFMKYCPTPHVAST